MYSTVCFLGFPQSRSTLYLLIQDNWIRYTQKHLAFLIRLEQDRHVPLMGHGDGPGVGNWDHPIKGNYPTVYLFVCLFLKDPLFGASVTPLRAEAGFSLWGPSFPLLKQGRHSPPSVAKTEMHAYNATKFKYPRWVAMEYHPSRVRTWSAGHQLVKSQGFINGRYVVKMLLCLRSPS